MKGRVTGSLEDHEPAGSAVHPRAKYRNLLVAFAMLALACGTSRPAAQRTTALSAPTRSIARAATESPPPPVPCELSIATFNIAAGSGLPKLNWEVKRDGIVDTIIRSGADIVLVQEVDRWSHRSEGRDILSELLARLGERTQTRWYDAYRPSCAMPGDNGRGQYGNAILSRWPITSVRTTGIETADRADRSCFDRPEARSVLVGQTAGLWVVSGHLATNSGRSWIGRAFPTAPSDPLVLGMDINEGDAVALDIAREVGAQVGATVCTDEPAVCVPTLSLDDTRSPHRNDNTSEPERDPRSQFDQVFVLPTGRSVIADTPRALDPRGASDHMAVAVDLRFPECQEVQ